MGYSCPVCEDPQSDDEHLANHLAMTAMLRGGDHEAWLDEHVPDWDGMSPAELAAEVTEDAEETEYPQVFEDTTEGQDHDTGQGHETAQDLPPGADRLLNEDIDDEETAEIIEEAREMTRKRRSDDAEE